MLAPLKEAVSVAARSKAERGMVSKWTETFPGEEVETDSNCRRRMCGVLLAGGMMTGRVCDDE